MARSHYKNNFRVAEPARKVRLVADAVRGMNVQKAINMLQFQPQGAAGGCSKSH